MEFLKKHKFKIISILAILLGIVLRFYKLDRQSLWYDELYSITASMQNSFVDTWFIIMDDPHPPLYQILLFLWFKIVGATPVTGRLFSVLIGVLSVLVAYYNSRNWENPVRRVVFTLLVSFSSGGIYFSQELRSYSLLFLLSIILCFLFEALFKDRTDWVKYLKFYLVAMIISYVHLFGFILTGSFVSIFFVRTFFRDRNKLSIVLFLGISILIAYLPFVYMLTATEKIDTAQKWIEEPNLLLYTVFFTNILYPSYKYFVVSWVILIAFLAAPALPFLRGKYSNGYKKLSVASFWISIVFGFLLLVTSIFSFFQPILTAKNLIVLVPLFYYVYSEVIAEFWKENIALVMTTIMLLFSVQEFQKGFYTRFKEDWRETAKIISEQCSDPKTSLVLTDAFPEYLNFYFQLMKSDQIKAQILPKKENIIGVDLGEAKKICFNRSQLWGHGKEIILSPESWGKQTKNTYGFFIEIYERKP